MESRSEFESVEVGDLAELGREAEDVPVVLESPDFNPRRLPPVGNYLSLSRTMRVSKRGDTLYFNILFEGGLIHEATGKTYFSAYPLKKSLSTTPFETEGGVTSSVAQYLRKFKIDPAGLQTEGDLRDALLSTLNQSIPVFISRTDKSVKDGNGNWINKGLKLRDFQTGVDGEGNPVYADRVTIEGVTYEGKAVVGSFGKAA